MVIGHLLLDDLVKGLFQTDFWVKSFKNGSQDVN